MKHFYKLLFLSIIFFASCSSSKKLSNAVKIQDGKSFETAVVITETHERQGITAEYAWINDKYPGYQRNGQSLVYHDKKPFDVIHIIAPNGSKLDLYFDISNFYGKF